MSQEQFIYYWDFSGFWRRQLEVMNFFRNNVNQLIPYVYKTLLFEEYSSFPQLFLIPHILLIGETYPRFVLAMVNTFLVPSQILLYVWVLGYLNSLRIDGITAKISIGVCILFFTGNYLPLILGYVGSAGLLWIIIVSILMTKNNDEKIDPLRFILIGIIMVFLVFIRRWFAYYVLAFFMITPLSYIAHHLISKTLTSKKFLLLLINLFISGMSSILILLIGFRPLISTFTQYDYKFAYQSVYTGLGEAIPWLINYYSPFQAGLLLFGIMFGLSNKIIREHALFAFGTIVFVIVTFYQVQIFGSHHYYIINVFGQLLVLFGVISLFSMIQSRPSKPIIVLILSILIMSNFFIVFLRQDTQLSIFLRSRFQVLSSSLNVPPRRSANVDVTRTIVEDLQRMTQAYEYIYVLAGSGNINDDMLRNALLPDQLNPLPTIEATKQLDTRDGVPKDFFIYTYIVVADPIQYHNGAPFQHVIGELANGMLNDPDLQPYYSSIRDYKLNNGEINVIVFKRIEDIPDSIKEKYRNLYRNLYPDHPFLYEFN